MAPNHCPPKHGRPPLPPEGARDLEEDRDDENDGTGSGYYSDAYVGARNPSVTGGGEDSEYIDGYSTGGYSTGGYSTEDLKSVAAIGGGDFELTTSYAGDFGLGSSVAPSVAQTINTLVEGLWHTIAHWRVLAFGQLLSLLLAVTGAASASLNMDCHLSAPTFQSLFVYVALAMHAPGLIRGGAGRCCRCEKARQGGGCAGNSKAAGGGASNLSPEDAAAIDEAEAAVMELREFAKPGGGCDGNGADDLSHGSAGGYNDGWSTSLKNSCLFGMLPLRAPVWAYFGLALLDVEANYLMFLAFRYTTLTSVTMFGALAIPSAVAFSRWALQRRYRSVHLLGLSVCIAGVLVNVLSDYEVGMEAAMPEADADAADSLSGGEGVRNASPHKMWGDLLAISGGILFGVNDVLAEMAIKTWGGQRELLAMLGVFGTVISAAQVAALELDDVTEFFKGGYAVADPQERNKAEQQGAARCSPATGFGLLFVYALANYLSYVGTARFLGMSEAALLNLSLLTADLYTVVFSVIEFGIVPPAMFWLALLLIVSGVIVYEAGPSPAEDGEGFDDGDGRDMRRKHWGREIKIHTGREARRKTRRWRRRRKRHSDKDEEEWMSEDDSYQYRDSKSDDLDMSDSTSQVI